MVADDAINVHELISVGKRIVEEMDGKDVFTYSFCRKDKVKALSGDEQGKSIDPALLFQRLLVVANAGNNDIKFEEGTN